MLGVVHLASRGRLVALAGPPAALVPQQYRVADPGRDVLAVPDVQRQAGTGEAGPQLSAAQEARQPAGAREEVDGLADDGLLDRGPGRVPRAVPPLRVQFGAQPDQVLMGIRQATANQVRSLEPSLETAGPACQIGAFPEPGCWALAGSGGVWQAWPVPGIRSVDQGA